MRRAGSFIIIGLLLAGCGNFEVGLEGGVDPGQQLLPGGVGMTFDRTGTPLVGWRAAHLPRGQAWARFGVALVDAAPLGLLVPSHIAAVTTGAPRIVVAALERASPLAHAGVRPFDVLTKVDGRPAGPLAEVVARLAGAEPETTVTLEVRRPDGSLLAVEAAAQDPALSASAFRIPLLFERRASSSGAAIGFGPLDVLFHSRDAVEHHAVPPPRPPRPEEGKPPAPPRPEAHASRSRFVERSTWGMLFDLVRRDSVTELPGGEPRSAVRIFWLISLGDDLEEPPTEEGSP